VSRSLSKHKKYVAKHKTPRAPGAPKKALRNTLVLSSVAAGATGIAISGGVLSTPASVSTTAAADLHDASNTTLSGSIDNADVPNLTAAQIADREGDEASRDDRRTTADPAKQAALSSTAGDAITVTDDVDAGDPRAIARALLAEFGYSQDQFGCLDSLWTRESGWRVDAANPYSSAYGIPQALPGSKMASVGDDWEYNPETQIRWGLGYIQDRYGSPCGAWSHSESYGWY
jgi:hypothetical protein